MPRRCALGCPPNIRGLLHVFPNPDKYPEQHNAWVKIVVGTPDCNFDYKKYRVCDRHFTDRDRTRSSRLNALAVPSLFLPSVTTVPSESVQTQGQSMEVSLSTEHPTLSDTTISSEFVQTQGQSMEVSLSTEHPALSVTTIPSEFVQIQGQSMEVSLSTEHPTLKYSACKESRIGSPEPGCSFAVLKTPTLNITNYVDFSAAVVRHISLEHNYCVSTKNKVVGRQRASKITSAMADANKYRKYKTTINNLRREVYRLRKKHQIFKTRLENAERVLHQPAVHEVVKKMTTPAKIFTMMQYTQTPKNKKGRRFTIDEKILSLSLYKKSPKCYALMAKMFTLPSGKSLKRLLSKVVISPGTNNDILFKNLKKQVDELNSENRLCSLIFDEMSITPQIHFDAFKDEIKGLVTHGKKNIANHALVFMVKGLRKPFKQPVAYYFTNSLNKVELKKIIIEVITRVNNTGLVILCTVCDQSTINVSAINDLINDTKGRILRKSLEMKGEYFSINSRNIIPLYDTPHLIKGLRNNLITKNLKYFDFEANKEKIVKWEYFEQLYWADKSFGELRCLQKLTEEHVVKEKIKKMRVKTATQLFSHSVAVATEHLSARGVIHEDCKNLINFVLTIDKLFDSLNVSCMKDTNGKIFKGAVRRNSPHHQLWEKSLRLLKSVRFIRDTAEFIPPSVKNLIKTIEGFQNLWKILFAKYSFDCMLTRNMNQDPIENFFGNIRSYGARNVAPNCIAFEGAYKSLLLNNYNSPQSTHANCESDRNKCLQNLKFFFKEGLVSSNTAEDNEIETPLREDLLNEIDIDVIDNGQRNYVCGWVLKKCLQKIVKKCEMCRNEMICKNFMNESNAYVKAKEYFCDKKWLCYPSMVLSKYFQEIQNVCVSHLKRDVPACGIKKSIKFYVNIFLTSPFKCETHKENLNSFFIDTTLNILIYSWCRNVNRILCGKITNNDVTDELKVVAQAYYNKHKHYKNPK